MKKLAVFDVDGTLFRSSLLIEVVEALIDEGVFDVSVRRTYAREKKRWLERRGDYEEYITAVVHVFMDNIKGVHYRDFARATRVVMKRFGHQTYTFTTELAQKLKKKGYFLVAISQSPKGVLDMFCKELGFDKIYGRFYELGPSDRFTGTVADEHLIENKANIVKRAVEREGLTLKGSIGIGDTEGDISMLEMVERPICFNPNKKLYKHAKRNGWEIVVERKDVVYAMSKKETPTK